MLKQWTCGAGISIGCSKCGNAAWNCRVETDNGNLCGMCLRGVAERGSVRAETSFVLWDRIRRTYER